MIQDAMLAGPQVYKLALVLPKLLSYNEQHNRSIKTESLSIRTPFHLQSPSLSSSQCLRLLISPCWRELPSRGRKFLMHCCTASRLVVALSWRTTAFRTSSSMTYSTGWVLNASNQSKGLSTDWNRLANFSSSLTRSRCSQSIHPRQTPIVDTATLDKSPSQASADSRRGFRRASLSVTSR